MTTYIRLARRSQSDCVLNRQLHGQDVRASPTGSQSRRKGSSSMADAADGPDIHVFRIGQVERDLVRCLGVGAWSVARRVVELARTPHRLNATDADLRRFIDGPPVDEFDVSVAVRRVCVSLMRSRVGEALIVLDLIRAAVGR